MTILSACYTCAGRGPLIESEHAVPVPVDSLADYLRAVDDDKSQDSILLAVWPLHAVPSCWEVMAVEGRGPGWLLCWVERPHMTFVWEILRLVDHEARRAANEQAK